MRIDRIDLYHVAMPLIEPWRTAYGEDHAVHSLLCRMTSDGLTGWGESSPLAAPCYSPEWAGGTMAVARHWLAPALIGHELSSGEQLQQRLAIYKGNPFAKAAFDTAWWALESRRTGTALHRLLGAQRDVVAVGADFGVMDSVDELVDRVGAAIDEGFARIKLKYRPGWDLAMLGPVRQAYPHHPIHIDCNSGYVLDDLPMFEELDRLDLAMIEQPLAHDDLLDHAQLQRSLRTAVCLDESVTHPRGARQALALKSCRYVNVKPGRVGGLTPAVEIHDICRASGIPCWVGGMLESSVGAAHCIALATLDNFTYPADIFPSNRFYRQDLSSPPVTLERIANVPHVRAFEVMPEPVPACLASCLVEHATVP